MSPRARATDTEIRDHDLLVVACAPTLGWWAECECGWISRGYLTEAAAGEAHDRHNERTL